MIEYARTAGGMLTDGPGDPMAMAGDFMAAWEADRGVSIGDGPGVDTALLDACLAEYFSQADAQAMTASLF